MSFFRLIIAGLVHHRRIHVAVALGVAAATAVLTGALVVGDSVRGSLRHLALDRLQRIDEVLVVPRFFRAQLAADLAAQSEFREHFAEAVPAALLEGTVEAPETHRRATHVNILGVNDTFGRLSSDPADEIAAPRPGEICLNEPLADELGATVGDEVLVRLPVAREVPADSALGRKTETVTGMRLLVKRIVRPTGLGQFALRPSQAAPRDAFVNLADVQRILKQRDKVNAILVGDAGDANSASPARLHAAHTALAKMFRPTLADLGISIRETPLGYFLVESDRMLFEPAAAAAAEKAFAPYGAQAAFTYLANTLADGARQIPYSTVTAIDFAAAPSLGGFASPDGRAIAPLGPDEIALNSWAADELGAKIGDTIDVTYFEPESTHGRVRETTVALRLAAIVALAGPAADANLTPTLPGVTDQLSISDWNPPFPFDSERIHPRDEEYWDKYRATPKAFVALATGRKLWGSRFGDTTSLRIPPGEERTVESLAAELRPDAEALGFAFQPVKLQAIFASVGTTPFEGLFLGFSFFIIAAALMLVAILFRLGVDERTDEIGVLSAVGWRVRRIRALLVAESVLVALAGAALGACGGVGYAWLMLAGLRTWWLAAIQTPFLTLFVTPTTIVIGALSGVVISVAVVWWSLRCLRRMSVRSLLAHQTSEPTGPASSPRRMRRLTIATIVLAIVTAAAGSGLGDAARAGAFLGSGALVLVALLALLSDVLRSGAGGSFVKAGAAPLAWMAFRNAGRNPRRSTLTMGLIAAASFLIIAISAFQLDPRAGAGSRTSGTGGFALVAESDRPIYQDINTEAGEAELGLSQADQQALTRTKVYALRVEGGDDASCLNLYQARQPRVLGVPAALVERGGFAFAKTAAQTPADAADPWRLLDETLAATADGRPLVPAVLDEATAKYALHLSGVGSTYTMSDGRGRPLELIVVGLLQNSVLQGALVVSEKNFLKHFPDASGYRFFLIDTPPEDAANVGKTLEAALGDFGFDATPADDRLAGFLAVQNTYLSTFQSLGGLGLLLGTFGLAAVQLRNVVGRRSELALLQAAGFRRALLARIVLWENALLLGGGLSVGAAAALVALLPHLVAGGAKLPLASLAATLGVVLAVGTAAGTAAVRAALRAPLLAALRGE